MTGYKTTLKGLSAFLIKVTANLDLEDAIKLRARGKLKNRGVHRLNKSDLVSTGKNQVLAIVRPDSSGVAL